MSLLDSILSKKKKLKVTETIVTRPDGRKFIETSSNTSNTVTEIQQSAYGYVVDTKPDNIPAKILDFLYLGSQDCCEEKVLSTFSIKHVLSIGIEAPMKYSNVNYKFIECLDLPETNLKKVIEKCIPFICSCNEKCQNVLVHCNAGVSRAASVVIGYLILSCGYSYSDALSFVKKARNCVKPNSGFEKQLQCL